MTDDEKLATRLRILRNHGQTGQYVSTERGWNSRLDEIQAAILRVKLRHWHDWTVARQSHARRYDAALRELPSVAIPRVPAGREHVYYLYTIRVPGTQKDGKTRSDLVQERLAKHGVASMVYYPVPLHLQPLYATLGGKPGDLRVSERAAREVLSLPIYPEMKVEQIDRVVEALREALKD